MGIKNYFKIYSPTPFDAAKALKLEEDFNGGCMAMSMYPSPDKMKMSSTGCFPGRYSPSYSRGPDQMRRCMGNPSVSMISHLIQLAILFHFIFQF